MLGLYCGYAWINQQAYISFGKDMPLVLPKAVCSADTPDMLGSCSGQVRGREAQATGCDLLCDPGKDVRSSKGVLQGPNGVLHGPGGATGT